jgi:predicted nuclease of predicted toxin-antitoxin system
MKFLIDAQLPPMLCTWFDEQGHEAVHVANVLGGQTPDREVAGYAEQHGLILVTKDDDFTQRHPPKVYQLVWLRCGNITNRSLRLWLSVRWTSLAARLAEGELLVEVR